MANPYAGAYPYGAGYGGYAQPGAPAYPPQVRCGRGAGVHGVSCPCFCCAARWTQPTYVCETSQPTSVDPVNQRA